MKYILLIWQTEQTRAALADEDDRAAIMADVGVIMEELQETGELVGGEALADATESKTIRVVDGVTTTTDGPFAEAKEQLAGYLLVETETPERAAEIAARWPDAHYGGAMEVRALMHGSGEEM
jgi:hypothetical protein